MFVAYYVTLLLFGAVGLAVNAACLPAGLLPPKLRPEPFFQRVLHRCFQFFLWWMRTIRVGFVRFDPGFATLPRKVVLVANHPGLTDITFLLARLPEALCIFKPSIRANPILGMAAVRAGYVISSDGVDAIRAAVDKVRAGNTLIVFPEGTRTPAGKSLGTLRPGFALIAQRAEVPVQLLYLDYDGHVLTKHTSWWRPQPLPFRASVEVGPLIYPTPEMRPIELVRMAEDWLRCRAAKTVHAGTPELQR